MDAVADQAGDQPRIIERGADDSRLARPDLAHGVEQVSDAGRAFADGSVDFGSRCVRVPDGDDDADGHEPPDDAWRHTLWRERHQHPRHARDCLDGGEIAGVGRAENSRVVDSPAGRIEKRTFKMQAQDAGNSRDGRRSRRQRRERRKVRRNQRRQKPSRAEGAMRAQHRLHRRRAGRVVEQDTAAAVDLQIDQARRENSAMWQHDGIGCRDRAIGRCHRGTLAGVEPHRDVRQPLRAIEHPLCHDHLRRGCQSHAPAPAPALAPYFGQKVAATLHVTVPPSGLQVYLSLTL